MLYSYVGHPIQGALTEFIQIQNDPRGEKLEFSNTRQYWHSRFKAFLWSAAYSTQWNIGPLSELTVEKYGTAVRQPWNLDGTWPCTKKPCVSGVGQVDLVMTPIGGFAWMLTEDLLDKEIARRVEGVTRNHFLIDLTRSEHSSRKTAVVSGFTRCAADLLSQSVKTAVVTSGSGERRRSLSLQWAQGLDSFQSAFFSSFCVCPAGRMQAFRRMRDGIGLLPGGFRVRPVKRTLTRSPRLRSSAPDSLWEGF
jgi:hypothetical protein